MVALSQSVDDVMDLVSPTGPLDASGNQESVREESVKNARIMIVDDEPYNILVARKFLAGLGYRNFIAISNSETVVETLRRHPPDVILLDIMMPKVSGFEVCEKLKNNESTKDIMILMVTALNELGDIERAVAAGTDDFLSKPVQKVELVKRVENMLRLKGVTDEVERLQRYIEQMESGDDG